MKYGLLACTIDRFYGGASLRASALIACMCYLLTACGVDTTAADDAVKSKQRWAIVASDARSGGVADLLTVELSAWDGVELVERDEIHRVLDELKLNASGLVEPDRAVQFGELIHADALVLLDTLGENAANGSRLRLVETRTSVRLLDVALPAKRLENEVAAIRAALKSSQEKLAVSSARRRLIGVMPIKTEEPGEYLKPFCRTLTTLVEVELHRHPRVVVLERSQLQRLTAESELTGVELKLRGATLLLETGIRRADDGQGMIATFRLLSPGGDDPLVVEIVTPSREAAAVRDHLVAAVHDALGDEIDVRQRVAPDVEAADFDRRWHWFQTAYRPEEAAEMAEAALALAPTAERLGNALRSYHSWSHFKDSRLDSHAALPAARRYQELRFEWLNKTAPADPLRRVLDTRYPFRPHVRIADKKESDEDQRIRAEDDALSLQTFDLLFAEAADSAPKRLDLLLQKLEMSAYLAHSARDFADALPGLLDKILVTMQEAGVPADLEDQTYAKFQWLMIRALGKAVKQADPTRFGTDDRVWKAEELIGLPAQLVRHDDDAVQIAGLYAQLSQQGEAGERAAVRLFSAVQHWPPISFDGVDLHVRVKNDALSRLRGTKWERDFVDNLLRRARQQRNPSEVLENRSSLCHLLWRTAPKQKAALGDRILSVLDIDHAANKSPAATDLRRKITGHLRDMGLRETPVLSLDDAPGAWRQYVARPIPLRCAAGENLGLQSVFVDDRDDARQCGGELVLAWSRPDRKLSIERVGLSGGKPSKFGPDILGSSKPFRGVQVAVGPDAIYVASNPAGFTVLREDSFEVVTEEQGAPSNDVWALAWWKDRLFIAFADSFASFDPVTNRFQLLASSVSVAPSKTCPFDGRGSFFIRALLADEANGCIWMSVQDNTLPRDRNGVWRYEPDSNKYQKIVGAFYANVSHAGDGYFLHLESQQRWALLNPKTAEVEMLTQYPPFSKSDNRALPYVRSVKVGEHIITDDGQLLTPDGQTQRADTDAGGTWRLLQRAGPGFITHYDADAEVLWHFEPKALGEQAAAGSAPKAGE